MRCSKIGRHRYNFFLLFSVVGILSCSFSFSLPSFAISDVVYNIDESNISSFTGANSVCGSGSDVDCSDYNYLIFEPIDFSNFQFNSYINAQLFVTSSVQFPVNFLKSTGSVVYDFGDSIERIRLSSGNLPSSYSFTLTLSEHAPQSDCPVCPDEPSGELAITSNGTYDVTDYASVDVDVPSEVVQGDYHNDLQDLKHSIIICGAILLVIYFFYCIYRMFFRTLGGV